MNERYVLFLCSLNPDRTDLAANKYPESGYVSAKSFKFDDNIMHGLYGTLWGKTETKEWLNLDPKAVWVVVRTEVNDEMIKLSSNNFYKFRSGMVVFSGEREACTDYIFKNAPKELGKAIIGVHQTSQIKDTHIMTHGFESCAATNAPSTHAVNVGEKGTAKSTGWNSHAICTGNSAKATAEGDSSVAITALAGSKCEALGNDCRAIAAGLSSEIVVGDKGIALGLAPNCVVNAGDDSMVLLVYRDEQDKLRGKLGYVGENLEANISYRLSESGDFVRI